MFKHIDRTLVTFIVFIAAADAATMTIWPIKCSHETISPLTKLSFIPASKWRRKKKLSRRQFKRYKSNKVNLKNSSIFPVEFLSICREFFFHDLFDWIMNEYAAENIVHIFVEFLSCDHS